MDILNPIAFILFLGGGIFVLAGEIQKRFPPKNINHLYGYRTNRSMKNQHVWDFAQRYSATKMVRMGIWVLALGGLIQLTEFQLPVPWGVGLAIIIIIIFPLLMLLQVESEIKKRFPND